MPSHNFDFSYSHLVIRLIIILLTIILSTKYLANFIFYMEANKNWKKPNDLYKGQGSHRYL